MTTRHKLATKYSQNEVNIFLMNSLKGVSGGYTNVCFYNAILFWHNVGNKVAKNKKKMYFCTFKEIKI